MSEDNGKLTEDELKALSELDIQDSKYSAEDRVRWEEVQKKLRAERYAEQPYNFVELKDVVCLAVKVPTKENPRAISVFMSADSNYDLNNAIMSLQYVLFKRTLDQDMQRAVSKIVPAKGGFLNGIRKMGKR